MRGLEKYTNTKHTSVSIGGRTKQTVLLASLIILLVTVIVLAMSYGNANNYRKSVKQQFDKRIYSSVVDAIEQVNRLTGGVQSNSASRLAIVRQYIYNIDQLNLISLSIEGEGGRLVPQEAISALYDDLDTYEKLVQTATSSTLEIQTTLRTHLTALKELL